MSPRPAAAPERRLDGYQVGITADRRWDEQAALLARRGATVVHGPTIRTLSLRPDVAMRAIIEQAVEDPPDVVLANTGIGMRSWFAAAHSWGLGEALYDSLAVARIYARGPKAAAAVQQWGLDVVATAPSERLDELVRMVAAGERLDGGRVIFQRHGEDASAITGALEALGATVQQLAVYDWALPDDRRPALRLVDAVVARRVHAVTFTSAPSVRNLMAIADEHGAASALRSAFAGGHVLAACVGPVCAGAAHDAGFGAPLVPERFRLGPLIRRLSDALVANEHVLEIGGRTVVLHGTVAEVDGERVVLTAREACVLAGLAARTGRVVSKEALRREIWGEGDTRVVEVTVARLRRRLGVVGDGIVAIPRRGYLLDGRTAS